MPIRDFLGGDVWRVAQALHRRQYCPSGGRQTAGPVVEPSDGVLAALVRGPVHFDGRVAKSYRKAWGY